MTEGSALDTALVCIDGRHYPAFKGDTMIADSGCSCHLVKSGEFLEDVEEIQESISGISKEHMLAVKKGKLPCAFKGSDGSTVHRTLFPVKVVQGLNEDLSLSRLNLVMEEFCPATGGRTSY